MTVSQWKAVELTFHDPKGSHGIACGIEGVFTGPSGKRIRREAFWDGNGEYKIRFAATELGDWSYTVTGLSGGEEHGTITCIPYDGDTELYKHGFVKVGPRGKYLAYADNSPFFWLGDTHWGFALSEHWKDSNDPRYESQFRAVVDRRAEQKFNVYQCNFHCEYQESHMNSRIRYFVETDAGLEPNLEFLKNDLDLKMAYLAEKGMSIAAGFTWCYGIGAPGAVEFYKAAARYLIARYGAYPMIWTLAGESAGYIPDEREKLIDGWREIALEIQRLDDYNHLQTTHYTNERPFPEYYQDEDWFDFTLNQAGHGDFAIDCRPFQAHRAAHPGKPFVEGESLYEQVLTLEPNGRRRATPAMMRRVAYTAVQCGATGYTYGCQGMWHLQWDEPDPEKVDMGFGSCEPWYKGIDYPGAYQLTRMKEFYESVGWHRLSPLDPACVSADTSTFVINLTVGDLTAMFMPLITADEEMKTIVGYYAEANRYSMILHTLTEPKYRAQWFLPESGRYLLIDDNVRPVNGSWKVPIKPVAGDAILVLTAQ